MFNNEHYFYGRLKPNNQELNCHIFLGSINILFVFFVL